MARQIAFGAGSAATAVGATATNAVTTPVHNPFNRARIHFCAGKNGNWDMVDIQAELYPGRGQYRRPAGTPAVFTSTGIPNGEGKDIDFEVAFDEPVHVMNVTANWTNRHGSLASYSSVYVEYWME